MKVDIKVYQVHFLAVGHRVRDSATGREGRIIEAPPVPVGEVLYRVRWEAGGEDWIAAEQLQRVVLVQVC